MEKNYNLNDIIDFLKKKDLLGMQCFCTRNIIGDTMINIYEKDGITIDLCEEYSYFEIFGLTDSDFNVIENFFLETLDTMGDLGHLLKLLILADREVKNGNN